MIYRQFFSQLYLILFFFLGAASLAQESLLPKSVQGAFEGFDTTIEVQNTRIFTGLEYIEKHRMINDKNKFFQENRFRLGTVIYEGQPYFNVPIKYNIYDDLLLVQLESNRGETTFKMIPNRFEGFVLDARRFVNIWEEGFQWTGIYELLHHTSHIQVLKKYRKSLKKTSDGRLVHYEFGTENPSYYFSYQGAIYSLTRRNLLDIFRDHHPVVKEEFKKFRKHRKGQREDALVVMFQNLDRLLNDNAQ